MRKKCTAVVLAAGRGSRMGTATAKQYLHIGGKPLLYYSLLAFESSSFVDDVLLMTDAGHVDYCKKEIVERFGFRKVSAVREGGSERYLTVYKALCMIQDERDKESREGVVMLHDGARPFLSREIIERAYTETVVGGACVVGMPVKDTIKLVDENGFITQSPKRRDVWAAQTPQAFSFPLIKEAFERQLKEDCRDVTDDAMVLATQLKIQARMVEGSYENIKVTTPEDLDIAEMLLKKRAERKTL